MSLPLSPLPHLVLLVIAETMERAWGDLSTRHAKILLQGDEAEITALLETRLNALRNEDACWEGLTSGVSRGRETTSFDGRHLEKRPDLSIHLTGRNFSLPLIVECKLIDHPDGKTVKLYCDDGLARFLRGDYAWATPEAFMCAYVRDRSSIENRLVPYLADSKDKGTTPDPYETELLPIPVRSGSSGLSRSRHRRSFSCLAATTTSPGQIELWHLWLSFQTSF